MHTSEKTILVVDDEPPIRRFLTPFLEAEGHVVVEAGSGREALSLIASHEPGVILLDLTPGYHADLMSYLFGSILAVPASDLWQMGLLAILVIAVVGYRYHDFLAMSYDSEFASLRGVPVTLLHYLLLAMIAVTVVMIIRVVGLILVIALLTIPPFIAEKYTRSLKAMMVLSSALSALFTLLGLWLSYLLNLTSGATIILVAAAGFLLAALGEKAMRRKPRESSAHVASPSG